MDTKYQQFLAMKQSKIETLGRRINESEVNPILHKWQRQIVAFAVAKGRAALWEDTGLGKTFQQIEWARLSAETSIIVTPLAVAQQTIREASKLGIRATYIRDNKSVTKQGMYVTNYEQLHNISPHNFGAVVLDESSILKQSTGKTRTALIEWAYDIPFKLACSATPAPNDPEELTNQCEWLGITSRVNMLSTYYIHDNEGWRVKKHARKPMMKWMSQWAVALQKPSDIGGDDTGYILPGLNIVPQIVESNIEHEYQLFPTGIGGVTGRASLRRKTLDARVDRAVKLVANDPGPWILWCGINSEANELAAKIHGAVNVHGSLKPEEKSQLLLDFADGKYDVLVTKPSIASQGLNYQHCHNMAFVGLGDSYERYYQAIRRCYRYGQTKVVKAHIIVSEIESEIVANVVRKEVQARQITAELIDEMRRNWNV